MIKMQIIHTTFFTSIRIRVTSFFRFSPVMIAFLVLSTSALPANTVSLLKVKGGINPASADYIKRGIEQAQEQKKNLVVITLDTPGGLLSSTKEIVQNILNAPLPVVIFVTPSGASATSAGVFITMSGHIAAMSPGTSIGAAHPVTGSGKDVKKEGGEDMAKKVENYASAFIEGIANKRGRNAKWAIQAVRNSVSITAEKALRYKVIDVLADDVPSLLKKIDGRRVNINGKSVSLNTKDAAIENVKMSLMQKILDVLSTPNIALLLLSLGSLGIIMEIYHPGTYFPGVLGGIAFLLGLISLQILPINYGGLALIALAMLLFVAEIMVPSFGVLGVGGIISFIFGAMFLFDTPDSDLSVSWPLVIGLALSFGAFLLLAGFFIGKIAFRKPRTGAEGLVGEIATVTQDIEPEGTGKVFFHGEYWNAVSPERRLKGDKVRISKVDGMRVYVENLDANRG